MTKLLKVIFPLIFWGIFVFIVLTVPYPESFVQAKLDQIFLFFIPLFFAIASTLKILLRNLFLSLTVSLGLIFLLILMALDSLNFVTVVLTIIPVGLIYSYFRKSKHSNLTKHSKIPTLTKLK